MLLLTREEKTQQISTWRLRTSSTIITFRYSFLSFSSPFASYCCCVSFSGFFFTLIACFQGNSYHTEIHMYKMMIRNLFSPTFLFIFQFGKHIFIYLKVTHEVFLLHCQPANPTPNHIHYSHVDSINWWCVGSWMSVTVLCSCL